MPICTGRKLSSDLWNLCSSQTAVMADWQGPPQLFEQPGGIPLFDPGRGRLFHVFFLRLCFLTRNRFSDGPRGKIKMLSALPQYGCTVKVQSCSNGAQRKSCTFNTLVKKLHENWPSGLTICKSEYIYLCFHCRCSTSISGSTGSNRAAPFHPSQCAQLSELLQLQTELLQCLSSCLYFQTLF